MIVAEPVAELLEPVALGPQRRLVDGAEEAGLVGQILHRLAQRVEVFVAAGRERARPPIVGAAVGFVEPARQRLPPPVRGREPGGAIVGLGHRAHGVGEGVAGFLGAALSPGLERGADGREPRAVLLARSLQQPVEGLHQDDRVAHRRERVARLAERRVLAGEARAAGVVPHEAQERARPLQRDPRLVDTLFLGLGPGEDPGDSRERLAVRAADRSRRRAVELDLVRHETP